MQRRSITNNPTVTNMKTSQILPSRRNDEDYTDNNTNVSSQKKLKYWAGYQVNEGVGDQVFRKKRNPQTKWQEAFFNGGIF